MIDPDPYPDPDSMNPDPQHWFPLTMISTTSLPGLLAYVYVDSGLKVFISFALAGLHNSVIPVDLRFETFFHYGSGQQK